MLMFHLLLYYSSYMLFLQWKTQASYSYLFGKDCDGKSDSFYNLLRKKMDQNMWEGKEIRTINQRLESCFKPSYHFFSITFLTYLGNLGRLWGKMAPYRNWSLIHFLYPLTLLTPSNGVQPHSHRAMSLESICLFIRCLSYQNHVILGSLQVYY